ncbi:TolC family protein [Desulfoferrobacter suflitae]|uniref:TolC family protein n=1 Tax=Desulfoferrobacter suflitae TaxID=2865782 RepID=UPI002164B9E8|nr:TolC family protein [Desulfoferrobacter suflitae]MCK8601325.1 TolC family protein [Desulfoferrobacter suflitae]
MVRMAHIIFALALVGGLLGACTPQRAYNYEEIVAEYGPQPAAAALAAQPQCKPDVALLEQPIGMADAVRIALHNNPDVAMAAARIRQSETMIDEANAAFWPSLGIYTEFLAGDAPSAYLFKKIDERQLPPNADFNDPGFFRNFESGIAARYNLYRGGRDLLRRRIAETGMEISELDKSAVENALVASVIQAYYSTLAAKDFKEIAADSIDTVSAQLKDVTVKYQAGGALKSEVLSLQVRLAQAEAELVQAQNHYDLALASLANLLGGDVDTPIRLTGEEWQPPQLPVDYESGMERALGMRPELLKVRQQLIAAKMSLDETRGEYLPQVDLQAKTYFDDADLAYDADRVNWTVGVILNWDLFSGFSTGARLNRARAVLDEMLAADRKATQSIQLDVKTAYLRKSEAEARLAVTRASVAQAEEALRLVQREYEGGSATIVRYMDVELARNRARILDTSARYDARKAQADMGRALGYFGSRGFAAAGR